MSMPISMIMSTSLSISMSMIQLYVHVNINILIFANVYSVSLSMNSSLLHVHVYAACICPCCMYMSILHVHWNAGLSCIWSVGYWNRKLTMLEQVWYRAESLQSSISYGCRNFDAGVSLLNANAHRWCSAMSIIDVRCTYIQYCISRQQQDRAMAR
jgi:hypothetical protein